MNIILALLLAFSNFSCTNTDSQTKDVGLMDAAADKTSEMVNEEMDISSQRVLKEDVEPAEPYEAQEEPAKQIKEKDQTSGQKVLAEQYERDRDQNEERKSSEDNKEEVEEVLIGDLNSEYEGRIVNDEGEVTLLPEREEETEKSNSEEISRSDDNADTGIEEDEQEDMTGAPDHSTFNSLLSSYVSAKGVVNYQGLIKDKSKLEQYLQTLSDNPVESSWSRNEKLAYWINAYNAFTIKLILDHYPVKSIQDIENGKPWDKKWIDLGGKTYSLNQIENDIIRPQFNEPRIHFAVNCAAKSCPPLANKAYTAGNLNALLEQQTKSFINNSKYNQINTNSVKISKIFDWYGVDFDDKIAFLNKYVGGKIANDAEIAYSEYDWSLNN